MKQVSDKDIQRIELEILKDVAAFCEQHDISYFLACGTALGAIRHNGFIPWDDDIDVAMPRCDYDRFMREYHSEHYDLLALEFDRRYPYPFAKVSDKRTRLTENIERPYPMGLYIDIFPMDGLPKAERERKRHLRRLENDARVLAWKRISRSKKVGCIHKIIQVVAKAVLMPVPISVLVQKYDRDVRKYPFETANYVGHLTTKAFWGSDEKPKELFSSFIKHSFEDGEFRLPHLYDDYLRLEYGDYMTLPPLEKRVKKHDYVVGWNTNEQVGESNERD